MDSSSFPVPVEARHFEDYHVGAAHEFGPIPVEEAEVVAFGRRFDPHVFHTDPDAAKQTEFGGLIASGWHTAALMMRLYAEHYLPRAASLGSPGVDQLRWLRPVRPGDRLWIRVTTLEARRSRSKPDRGVVRSSIEVLNQRREIVMTLVGTNFLRCRQAG